MSIVIRYIDYIQESIDKNADKRTTNWFLIKSPFPTLVICLCYVYAAKVLGPNLMKNRKPFHLKKALIAYNFFQILFSTWLFKELCVSGWATGRYSFRCQPVEYTDDPLVVRITHVCWWYYFSKFTEFLDTMFFILRKKNSHISTLHVIHHGVMPMSVWFGVKYTPGGHATFFGLLNTFVHIIMYTYYFLAAFGPQVQKYLWWKKYLTSLQMIQFLIVTIHAFQLLFIDCRFPTTIAWLVGSHAVMFFFLFKDYYNRSYRNSRLSFMPDKSNTNTSSNGINYRGDIKMVNRKVAQQASDYYSLESIHKKID